MNLEQNGFAQLLLMAEFTYKNSKNANTGHILFKLYYGYHLWIFFENKCNVYSKPSLANKLAMKLRELMNICSQNLLHAQDLKKKIKNKGVKPWNYVPGEKV